jgi:DNA segregation ATPase FtsK/SpoIIIE, S-DNA-T family
MVVRGATGGGTVDGTVVSSTVSPADHPVGRRQELKPLVADWLKDRDEFITTVIDTGHRAGHTVLWHVIHSPLHAGRILKYAPRGGWRVTAAVWGWVFQAETKGMRQEHALNRQTPEWLKLEKERKERVALRWRGLALLMFLGLVALVLLWFLLPNVPFAFGVELTRNGLFGGLGVAVLCGLGYVGRPLDGKQSLFQPATATSGDPKLTNDLVLDALCSLGIAKMNDPVDIELLYGVKPTRAGYNIDLTLPRGVEATEVMAKRGKLSSALQRGIGTVWPSVGPRHEGHLMLFISHEDMSQARQKPWPLLKSGSVDIFNAVPMFTDQRGDWVELRIATTSGVVGAIPRMGKSYFLRELGLVGALDVRVEEYIFELKGTGDLSSLKLVAHYYSDSDEEEDIVEHLTVMRRLREERRRRAKVIRSLPNEQCPRSEVTSELASRHSLGLHPVLVEVDEVQVWTEHEIKAVREEFIAILEDLVRRGPAVGIMVYLATQKVDAKSIPTGISANSAVRLCFKVNDATSNNQILGPGSYANGLQATMFDFEKDKGIAYLKAGGPAQIVRTVFSLDKVESEKVALRARSMRKTAGRLTGYAAGEEMEAEEEQVVLLDDVRRVMGNADAMHLGDIAAGLAELRPAAWGSLTARSLGTQLRTVEVRVENVYVADKSRDERVTAGVKREWLDVSATRLVGDEEPAADNVRSLTRSR